MSLKIKYIATILVFSFCILAFSPSSKMEKTAAWAYVNLVATHRFAEAAMFFEKLAKQTNEKRYTQACSILQNTPSALLDYNDFYHTFVAQKDTIFNSDFFSKGKSFGAKEIALGKILFFDPVLSANEKRTCASCHRPEKAFCDQRIRSKGFDFAKNLTKNSPTLLNVGFQSDFFHESTAKNIEEVIASVIQHPQEFNNAYEVILGKLNGSSEYSELLKTTYGTNIWTKTALNQAMESYIRSLTAYESSFDKMMQKNGKKNEQLAAAYNIFMGVGKCGNCHRPPSFGGTFLPFSEGHLTFEIQGKMIKVPSLRNVSMTMPYMYDGRVLGFGNIQTTCKT